MEPYKKFANPRYARMFNYFLKNVVEPKFKKKYHKDIKLKLYGIGITPKSSVYDYIPKEELLDSQATVSFFIDTEPSYLRTNFIEDLILLEGRVFLQLQNGDYLGYDPEKFRIRVNFNNRALYPLSYIDEKPIEENRIKTRLLKENIESRDFKWHFEKRDRKIKVIQSNDWMLQFENRKPRPLKEGQIITIPKGVYHRVIKGDGDLIIKIKEY